MRWCKALPAASARLPHDSIIHGTCVFYVSSMFVSCKKNVNTHPHPQLLSSTAFGRTRVFFVSVVHIRFCLATFRENIATMQRSVSEKAADSESIIRTFLTGINLRKVLAHLCNHASGQATDPVSDVVHTMISCPVQMVISEV